MQVSKIITVGSVLLLLKARNLLLNQEFLGQESFLGKSPVFSPVNS